MLETRNLVFDIHKNFVVIIILHGIAITNQLLLLSKNLIHVLDITVSFA